VLDRHAVQEGNRVAEIVGNGVDWIQLRERELADAELLALARRVVAAAGAARVLVNRRLDVALASDADGVHLGFDAVAAVDARSLLGPQALVGVSCHAPEEVAAAEGAGYAHLAPIFPPLSKPPTRAPLGLGALTAARGARPVLAQGGVTAGNAGDCLAAGAAGVAVTGAILQAPDPAAAARGLRAALDRALP
jgi:thiamine-phosphate pyrophosphorylase